MRLHPEDINAIAAQVVAMMGVTIPVTGERVNVLSDALIRSAARNDLALAMAAKESKKSRQGRAA